MKNGRTIRPILPIVAGLLGIVLFLIASRYRLAILPAGDFAKGLWFGVCIGLELVGLFSILKARRSRAIG